MVFVHLGGPDEEHSFEAFAEHVAPSMAVQRLADAKMAQVEDFIVDANWKLIYENNRECDHCASEIRTRNLPISRSPCC